MSLSSAIDVGPHPPKPHPPGAHISCVPWPRDCPYMDPTARSPLTHVGVTVRGGRAAGWLTEPSSPSGMPSPRPVPVGACRGAQVGLGAEEIVCETPPRGVRRPTLVTAVRRGRRSLFTRSCRRPQLPRVGRPAVLGGARATGSLLVVEAETRPARVPASIRPARSWRECP